MDNEQAIAAAAQTVAETANEIAATHDVPTILAEPPRKGEIFRVLPDGRWALFFDSHTIATFTDCQQKFAYSSLERLRHKGPEAPVLSIGTWWSMVSERFYMEMAIAQNNTGCEKCVECATHSYSDATTPGFFYDKCETHRNPPSAFRIAQIALEAWVHNDMDKMAISHPKKYEEFAMPCDAGMFASMLGLKDFDHAMMIAYANKAKVLREQAAALEKSATSTDPSQLAIRQAQIQRMFEQADKLERLTILPLGPILMAVQYHSQFAANDFKNLRIIGAENPYGGANEVMVGEDNRVVVFYHGRPDLVIYDKPSDCLMPLDQKTVEYVQPDCRLKYKPHSQMAGYMFTMQKIARDLGYTDRVVDRCLISVCARKVRRTTLKKNEVAKPRFMRVHVTYTPQEIEEWRGQIMAKANLLRSAIEQNYFVMNYGFMCHVYGACPYRGLCNQPPDSRHIIKNVDYVQVEPWSPLSFDDDED